MASSCNSNISLADGVLRLYRNYDPAVDQGPVQMVSAFRGLTELVTVRQGAGVVMDWKQSAGILLVGGDSRIIKVWDAQTETPTLVSGLHYHKVPLNNGRIRIWIPTRTAP